GGGNGTSFGNIGIYQENGAKVTSMGMGVDAATITLDGTGGVGTSGNHGVLLSGASTDVSSIDGDISVTGQGGMGSSNLNHGVTLQNGAAITSTGGGASAATITLDGTGGGGTNGNSGVVLRNFGTTVSSEVG